MSTETEFERDVTAIVRKVVAKDYNSAMAGLEERLVEKLQDILKHKETETIPKNSRGPIETAPMVVIPEGFDPELLDVWAYTAAAQEGKWVALVYNTMAEIPRISDSLANGRDVSTVSRAHGQQSMTFKNRGRILWLAKDLKGGRGVSVNLVLRVEGRGEGAKLCMANEEKLFARQSVSVQDAILDILKPSEGTDSYSAKAIQSRLKEQYSVDLEISAVVSILRSLAALEKVHIYRGTDIVTYSRYIEPVCNDAEILDPSPCGDRFDQVWNDIFSVLPVGAGNAIEYPSVVAKVKSHGGLIYPNSVYFEVLQRMVTDAKYVNRRFSGQWRYYRSA